MTQERRNAFSTDQIEDTINVITQYPNTIDFDLPNVAIAFAFRRYLPIPLSELDKEFIAEFGPLLYRCFFDYLRQYTPEQALDQMQYDALSANYLKELLIIGAMVGDPGLLENFDPLKDLIKSRQTQYGQALTDYILDQTKINL